MLSDYTKKRVSFLLLESFCRKWTAWGTSCGSYSDKLISVDRHWDRTKSIMERCNTSVSYTRIWIGKRDGYFGIHILTKSAGHVELVLLGMVSFFLTGCLFGLLGAIIAFVSDARVLVYAMPMIIMETGCGGLYAISLLFGRDSVAANVLAYFYNITGAYISFGNLLSRCIVIFLIILMLCIGKGMESKVVRYYLGEEIRQV